MADASPAGTEMNRQLDAVVIGSGANALGVLRALGKAGLHTAMVCTRRGDPAAWSRFVRKLVVASREGLAASWVSDALGCEGHRPMLFLTGELDVGMCLREPAEWQRYFTTYFFTPEVAARMLSKAEFHRLAMQAEAPVPRTWIVSNASSVTAIAADAFPVVVKPARRDPRYTAKFARAYRANDAVTLKALVANLLTTGIEELVVQQWIDGEDGDIYFNFLFLDDAGALRSSFVGRKLLCWPPALGGTAACVAAPERHDELTDLSLAFLQRVAFRGLIGIEYKLEQSSRRFYMIEPTVYRTDHQHEVASLNGCDFLLRAYLACMGESFAPSPNAARSACYSARRYWADFPAARYSAAVSGSDLAAGRGMRGMHAWFRWNDPLPGLLHHGAGLRASLQARLRRRRGEFSSTEESSD